MDMWKHVCREFEKFPVVRKTHLGWKGTLEKCAVFEFSSPDEMGDETYGCLIEEAAPLPFPETAMAMPWGVLVFKEFWRSDGSAGGRILCATLSINGVAVVESAHVAMAVRPGRPTGPCAVEGYRSTFRRGVRFVEDSEPLVSQGHFAHYLPFALRFLRLVNAPSCYVVETDTQEKRKPISGRISRLRERPTYILLDKDTIKRRYRDSQPSGRASPMPHLRRGHYRTLASNVYKEPGKRVWVRAAHVAGNTVEWREGKRHYKVI